MRAVLIQQKCWNILVCSTKKKPSSNDEAWVRKDKKALNSKCYVTTNIMHQDMQNFGRSMGQFWEMFTDPKAKREKSTYSKLIGHVYEWRWCNTTSCLWDCVVSPQVSWGWHRDARGIVCHNSSCKPTDNLRELSDGLGIKRWVAEFKYYKDKIGKWNWKKAERSSGKQNVTNLYSCRTERTKKGSDMIRI